MAEFKKAIYVKAAEQKCVECIYDPHGGQGTWREQVKACTDASCPLYPIRPLPNNEKHGSEPVIADLVARRRQELRVLDEQ